MASDYMPDAYSVYNDSNVDQAEFHPNTLPKIKEFYFNMMS